MTFQIKASHIGHTKTQNEWFDIDCNTARRDFNAARNNFNRIKNDEARRNFTRAPNRYNKVKKKAKQKFKIQEGQRIIKLAKRNTRKFWKSLRKTFKKKQDEADSLTLHDLHEHFKSVFGESGENDDDNLNPNTYNPNEHMTENHVDGELNADFSKSELRKAVFKQKDNKSPQIDSISSEILKASYDTISPFLLSLYNRMFMTAEYPWSWGEGIKAPIFKKRDVNNAGNYRGSPLLFMLFVNDIIENINSDLEDIFTLNEIKLFLILYADDQVAFAKSPETLQKILTDIENYCNLWGLKINTQKTKAMIFEKGRRTHHDFYIYNTALEVVESFKYLGLTLFKNGNWNRSQNV